MVKSKQLFITYMLITALIFNITTCDAAPSLQSASIAAAAKSVQQWLQKNQTVLAGLVTLLTAIIIRFCERNSKIA